MAVINCLVSLETVVIRGKFNTLSYNFYLTMMSFACRTMIQWMNSMNDSMSYNEWSGIFKYHNGCYNFVKNMNILILRWEKNCFNSLIEYRNTMINWSM